MLIIMCISGWLIAVVSIACVFYLLSEYGKLADEIDDAKMDERVVKSLMMVWRDKAQRLDKEIYGLSDNRCNECGQFLPKNQEGLCEACAWAKGGDI